MRSFLFFGKLKKKVENVENICRKKVKYRLCLGLLESCDDREELNTTTKGNGKL